MKKFHLKKKMLLKMIPLIHALSSAENYIYFFIYTLNLKRCWQVKTKNRTCHLYLYICHLDWFLVLTNHKFFQHYVFPHLKVVGSSVVTLIPFCNKWIYVLIIQIGLILKFCSFVTNLTFSSKNDLFVGTGESFH